MQPCVFTPQQCQAYRNANVFPRCGCIAALSVTRQDQLHDCCLHAQANSMQHQTHLELLYIPKPYLMSIQCNHMHTSNIINQQKHTTMCNILVGIKPTTTHIFRAQLLISVNKHMIIVCLIAYSYEYHAYFPATYVSMMC